LVDLLTPTRSRLRFVVSSTTAALGLIASCSPFCLAQTSQSNESVSQVNIPINAPIPPITIDYGDDQVSGASRSFSKNGAFSFTGGVTVVGGNEFTLRADSITGNQQTGVATAVGHVYFREINSYIDMDSLFVTDNPPAGSAQNVLLRSSPYTINAQRMTFESSEIDLYSTTLTTCPPDQKSDYSIRASRIVYQPEKRRITIYNGSFYLGKTRIFEFKKLSRRTGTSVAGAGSGGDKLFNESIGYTSYNGPFISYTTHYGDPNNGVTGTLTIPERHSLGLLLVAKTPLITPRSHGTTQPTSLLGHIRQAVQATEPILPDGDPLLFHWFATTTTMDDRFATIPNSLSVTGTATASDRERVFGHDTDNLFYSRLPEGSLTCTAPISGPRTLPSSHDPGQVRASLRQIALYAVITPTVGRYYEYPDNITSNRESIETSIESRPILIGDNLLFKPTVTYQDSTYPKEHESFQVLQYDVALEKYITDETGFGLEFVDSHEDGVSPFQFDTPYATRELDGRCQVGYPRIIVGAVLRYNLTDHNLYSEEIMIAPVLRGVIPKFTYDFGDSTFGIGVDIKGLTY